jgi:electron transfer flavoprotein alpha subunit
MADHKGVFIYGEVSEGKLAPVTLELLGIGRRLADARGEECSVVLIDRNAAACGQEAITYGANRVYVIQDAPAEDYEGASFTAITQKLCTETVKPAILLLGQTITGRDLAPRLAFRLKAGLVTDCIGLDLDSETKNLIARKPVSGGNVLGTYCLKEDGPQIATVRRRAMEPLEGDETRQGEIVDVAAGVDASEVKARRIERVLEESEGPSIENAEIVVAGGRGIDTTEAFEEYITNGLANALGAGVGGTRGAVDAGLISEQNQVGLTGKIVGPNLYIAVALSGAIQHMAGCSGSRNIVAINLDENAQIFKFARFGVVGDYKRVLPPLIEKLKELLST